MTSSAAPLPTLEDYERAARARVDRVAWEYISIGAADEISLRWNVDAYRSLSATCMYGSAGVYTVRATVSDEDGGTSAAALYRYVVVFDADGGSVTAGGFYDIPGQGRRKAHFTFSARFLLPGQSTAPKGR